MQAATAAQMVILHTRSATLTTVAEGGGGGGSGSSDVGNIDLCTPPGIDIPLVAVIPDILLALLVDVVLTEILKCVAPLLSTLAEAAETKEVENDAVIDVRAASRPRDLPSRLPPTTARAPESRAALGAGAALA